MPLFSTLLEMWGTQVKKSKMESYLYNIHDILKIKIIGKQDCLQWIDRKWSFFKITNLSETDLEIFIGDFKRVEERGHFLFNKYYVGQDYIFWRDSRKGAKWQVAIECLEKDKTKIYFKGNRLSHKYLFFDIIEPLIHYKLSLKGCSFLHASCIAKNGQGYVFPSLPSTGKTSIILNLLGHEMNEFLSDELTILSKDGLLYSYPLPISLFNHTLKSCPFLNQILRYRDKIQIGLVDLVCKLSKNYINPPFSIGIKSLFGRVDIPEKSFLSAILLLSKTTSNNFRIERNIDTNEFIQKLILINKLQFRHFQSIVDAYSYVKPKSKVISQWDVFKENLSCLKNVPCYEVQVPIEFSSSDSTFIESIKGVLRT